MNDLKSASNQRTEEMRLIYELKLACSIEHILERLNMYKNAKEKIVNDYGVGCEIDISNSAMINVNIKTQEHGKLEKAVKEYTAAAGKPSGISSTNSGITENTRR